MHWKLRSGILVVSYHLPGIILAATFAALTTMPIADFFVFGFIVAIGILIDTFLVRGMLLPALILLFEKDKQVSHNEQ